MKRISFRLTATLLMIIFTLLCGRFARATTEWIEAYNNTRSLGMGGASVAITSDETALFRNPANLSSVRGFYGTILDPELEGSTYTIQQAYEMLMGQNVSGVKDYIESHPGTYYHSREQISPSVVFRNFGFGLIQRKEFSGQYDSTTSTNDVKFYDDLGAYLGISHGFFGGLVKIGASVKVISRIEIDNNALPSTADFDAKTVGAEGVGIGYDAGIIIQAPWRFTPTLAAVVHDIGNTVFDKQDGFRLRAPSRPNEVKQSIDVAASLFPIHQNNLRSVWTLEYSDVANSRSDNDLMKRVHFGLEVNSGDLFFFRAGLNQRYWTAGFEIAGRYVTWQVASYGEEIGTADTPREDRRYTSKVSFRF